MKRFLVILLTAAGLLSLSTALRADNLLLTVRSNQTFPEAMLELQTAISSRGYTVARVQHVDIGLTQAGYKTDKYRIVFYGKPKQVEQLTETYPALIPYLPHSFSIFAEQGQTLVVAMDPLLLSSGFKEPELQQLFRHWSRDVHAILTKLRKASKEE